MARVGLFNLVAMAECERYRWLEFPHFDQPIGETVPMEFDDQFPFVVKRAYTITGYPGVRRGGHAHQIEEEVFVCVAGTVTAVLDQGAGEERVRLDSRARGLWVGQLCWHEFHDFTPETVVLCLSSTHYLPGETNYLTTKEALYEALGKVS